MISYHKAVFFDCNALAEANRYEAALFAAVEYNRPRCVEVMVNVLGPRDVYRHDFYTSDNQMEQLSAAELAQARGMWSFRSSLNCCFCYPHCRVQWLRGRASDSRLREPGFEFCAAVLKPWASFFTLHCSSSLTCSGDYVYEEPYAY